MQYFQTNFLVHEFFFTFKLVFEIWSIVLLNLPTWPSFVCSTLNSLVTRKGSEQFPPFVCSFVSATNPALVEFLQRSGVQPSERLWPLYTSINRGLEIKINHHGRSIKDTAQHPHGNMVRRGLKGAPNKTSLYRKAWTSLKVPECLNCSANLFISGSVP